MTNQPGGPGTLVDALDPDEAEVDREAARRVARQLRETDGAELMVRTSSGEMEKMPHGVARLLASMLEEMAEGHTVALVSEAEEVSTSVAAAFLGVSRPHVVKLIETGLLPRRMAGSHRRVRLADLAAYKRALDGRHEFLDRISAEAQEMGLYDEAAPPVVR
jgi:excisionase family DNA binding protein